MYDLRKIVIIGNYDSDQQIGLQTTAMLTDGLRVESLLYLDDVNSMIDKEEIKESLKSELYDDQYDNDTLTIKIKEVINGEHAINKLSKFISKHWNSDTLIYYYLPTDKCFEMLEKNLREKNVNIFISKYHDLFIDNINIEKDIYTIMKEQGLKTENMYKDSQISLAYFLSCLVEKIMSK
jgi:hypothetical protein